MIKLFLPNETKFETNGEIVIKASRCVVKNGADFALEMVCPVEYADYIEGGNILFVPTPQDEQPFRIYDVNKGLHKLTVKAKHLTYDAENYIIPDRHHMEDPACQIALNICKKSTDIDCPFTLYSDIATGHEITIDKQTLHSAIKDISSVWGGHIVRDKWDIKVLSSINHDNGITIEYGKNMQDISADYDFSNVVTKVLPIGKDGITLDDVFVEIPSPYEIPYSKVVNFDQSIEADDYLSGEAYTQALKDDLLKQATDYLNAHKLPNVNYTLKGKPEKVTDIGDLILVKDKRINVELVTQVISYEWDAIGEKFNSLEFGNFTDNLNDLLGNIQKSTVKTIRQSSLWIKRQVFPVGTIYSSAKLISPGTLFGGVWDKIKEDAGLITWQRIK